MSHSNFKLIANDEPINRNLVIIVNKNGDVKTDTLALQNLLTSRDTPQTGVTVIRETSPTPSISDEIEEDTMHQHEILRQQYLDEHPNATEEDIAQQMSNIIGIPHVSLNVENFYTPEQARRFANDVLHLGGIDNPSTLMPIDQNFRRQIVQNDHCYTPLTLSPKDNSNKEKKPATAKTNTVKGQQNKESQVKGTKKVRKEPEIESSESGEEEEDVDEEQSAEEISFSESDDDNDMDFSVNDRFGKKGKKKRKYRRHKQKSMTFKDFLEGGGEMSSMDDEPKKKYGKSPKKSGQRVSGKNIGPSTSKSVQQQAVIKKSANPGVTGNKNAGLKKEGAAAASGLVIKSGSPAGATLKTNSPAGGSTKLNSPITALVKPNSPVVGPVKTNNPNLGTLKTYTPSAATVKSIVPNNNSSITINPLITPSNTQSIAIKPTIKPNTPSVLSQISIQSAAPTKTTQEIEFVESIVKDLEKSFPVAENSKKPATTIPNIIQMMDTSTPTEVIDQSLSSLEHIDGNVGIEEIGDAIIAVLGNEAIDELLNQGDLMNFEGTGSMNVKPSSNVSSSCLVSDQPAAITTTSPLPKILNKQAPIKDPIKVVRNGRVITLPPIEAPTTRGAKRRAQGDPISTSPVNNKIVKSELAIKSPTKDPDSRNSSRRSSLNKSESGRKSRRQSTAVNADDENDDATSDVSWNSEDDPDRLWCICKQPHNNRFMICCDKCEEWFHGTCVNVTKAMGKDIEKQNIKWHCPNCKSGAVKDPNKKSLNQQKLTKFFSKNMKESTDEDVPKSSSLVCAVCHKKPARTDSIYCSEDCIRNHATKHLDESQPKTPKLGDGKRGNVLKDQSGNVSVYDRTTGKLLSAKLWPHITNLGQWLSQNPNCEPVKPGSHHANQLLSRSGKKETPTSPVVTSTSTTKHSQQQPPPPADELFSNPIKINTGAKEAASPTLVQKKLTNIQSPIIRKITPAPRPPLQKSTSVTSTSSSKSVTTPKVQEVKKIKKQLSEEKPQAASTPSSNKSKIEYERMNVRTNLKTTLQYRMKDVTDPSISKMSEVEIEKFATAIEREMFLYFNKDTRDKYKVKFRSLKFNLSDTKNKTLIERICMKKLTPKQLVELPSSELASKELSKWREEENKHQLEIITKSELDALAQNKMVIKTHKGEEIIETTAAADISLPDEDVESVIEKNVLSVDDPHGKYDLSKSISLNVSGNHSVSSPLSSPSVSSSTGRKSDGHHHDSHHSRSRSKSRDRHHHHHKSSASSKHKKGSHHSRDKSRGRRHSRDKSREKSRDRSRERDHSKKHSEDHHKDKHHRDKSRSNEKDKEKSNSRSKDSRESSKDSKKHHHHSHHHHHHTAKDSKEEISKVEIKPEQEDVDIVGKILDSMGVHLDTKPKAEDVKTPLSEDTKMSEVSSSLTDVTQPISVDPVNEHQLQIEIYSGNMYMADVAKFDVTASVVSGNIDDIVKLFNPQMEIVGRIEPKTVWDYLGKVKKLPGKELAVLRFASTDESAYFSLFSYLHSRQRYGVIKSPAPNIKDFYLITVEANRPLPPVLLPITGPGFIEGEEHKPDLLLGVILKIIPESKHLHKKAASSKKTSKTTKPSEVHSVPIQILPTKHKSHHSHGSSKLTMGLPDLRTNDMKLSPKNSPSSKDDDEPYTPFDEDERSLTPPRVFSQHAGTQAASSRTVLPTPTTATKMNTSDDLETEMEKLNKEIERRQIEIQTLAQQKALELDEEQATKIFEKISVPHNLSEILSTIKASEPKPMDIDDDDDEEYVPSASKTATHEYRASSSYAQQTTTTTSVAPIANSMMDIDERINLFRQEMMPAEQVQQTGSRLATMSDADLLALVPEEALQAPPPPIISSNSITSEPAIPGLEYEMEQ